MEFLSILKTTGKIFDKCGLPFGPAILDFFEDRVGKSAKPYNIGLFGPSRIGKTTLIAAMIEEFKVFSDDLRHMGEYLKLTESDEATKARISTRINSLKSGICGGSFRTGTLDGTSSHEEFNLRFEDGREKAFRSVLSFHDFPGGWINSPDKIDELEMAKWDVLILPVDAAVVMESVQRSHIAAAYDTLCIKQVEDVVRDWTARRQGLPSLCIFAPIKCETYFTTPRVSTFLRDKSATLFSKVTQDYYRPVLDIIKKSDNVECLYMPVNTVGCCFLKKPTWTETGELCGEYSISPEPGMESWKPFGPSYIVLEVCLFIANQVQKNRTLMMSDRVARYLESTRALREVMRKGVDGGTPPYERTVVLQRGAV